MASPAVAELHSEAHAEQPLSDTVALPLGIEVPPPYEYPSSPAEQPEAQASVLHVERSYPSLYDTQQGTLLAVALASVIIGGVLWSVARIYQRSRDEHAALTQFVTTMVALVVGAYIADLLVAGPDTSLLTEGEHASILSFIKDTCLMVFSYYFGTRAVPPPQVPVPTEPPAPSGSAGEVDDA
jgi:hypothetical protein